MKLYSIKEFSELVGVTTQTLRNWDKTNYLKPATKGKGGYRYYSEEQLKKTQGLKITKEEEKIVIGYCRVSSNKQKDDLIRQKENIQTYMLAKGYKFKIIEDIGSGINYNKKGLKELLELINSNKINKIVVLYKDRLIRFGYELIKHFCDLHNVEIEIIDSTEKTEEQELVEDLVQIITVFSCKLQGKRAGKAKAMIKEIIKNDSN